MDSFTDDLNSPLPKQMQLETMDDVRPSSLPTDDCAASTTRRRSEIEGRQAIALRPLSERLGRITLKRGTPASASQETKVVSSEDPFRNVCDDVLEGILARLPLFPLKAAKKVCKRWASVITTPQFEVLHKELGEQQPWLVGYGINRLVPSKSRGFAYDVESDMWVTLQALQVPAHNSGSLAGASGVAFAVAGPGEDRLRYKLTSSASSAESFGETWYETPRMTFPRSSPVVSVALGPGMGHKVVVAGGVPEFEDEHRAVEVFDSEIGTWEFYGDLPEEFSEYNSRTWMSGVVCDNKFCVSLLHSWPIHVLDFRTRQWASMQLERPEDLIYHHVMAIGRTLVVAGLCAASVSEECAVKLWKVDWKTLSLIQIGLMPTPVFATLRRLSLVPTLTFLTDENLVYVSAEDGELVVGEVSLEDCKTYWRGLPRLSALGFRFDSVITFCASIGTSPETTSIS